MSTRNLPGGKERPAREADNLTAICEPIIYKMWESQRLTTSWASTACYRDSFTVTYIMVRSLNWRIIPEFGWRWLRKVGEPLKTSSLQADYWIPRLTDHVPLVS
jgi:hypothetical protein